MITYIPAPSLLENCMQAALWGFVAGMILRGVLT